MNAKAAVGSGVATVRRRPFLDHLIRAYSRYQADGGDRLAASVTYFGFLSFFPLVALAFSIAGFVVDAYPSAQQKLTEQINSFLPGLADKLDVNTIGNAKVATGIIGLAGLVLAGTGWIDALREAVRGIWHHNVKAGNPVVKKAMDVLILGGLGLTLLVSMVVTGVSSSATTWALKAVDLEGSTPAKIFLHILGIVLALAVDTAIFLYLFTRLPRLKTPLKKVIKGAMLGAVGLEILKVVGSILVARTTSNPVYGAFAVVVGLLIWINLVSRWMLLVAAWTVTAPFDTDVPPSGTASPEAARKAGIPEEFADHDPDNPPTTVPDGAPAPLAAALQGETPPQDQEEGEVGERAERSRRGGSQQPEALGGDPADVYPEERRSSGAERGNRSNGSAGSDGTSGHAPGSVRLVASESSVRTAGRVSAGMMLAGAAGAALYGAKVLRGTVRSDDD